MSTHPVRYLAEGKTSPGVLLVIPQDAEIREVIDTLVLLRAVSDAEDWVNRVTKIPF